MLLQDTTCIRRRRLLGDKVTTQNFKCLLFLEMEQQLVLFSIITCMVIP